MVVFAVAAGCHPEPRVQAPVATPAATATAPAPAAAKLAADTGVPAKDPTREIEAALNAHSRSLYACVERELTAQPMLDGRLSADVAIGTTGDVTGVTVVESTFRQDTTLRACLVEAWRRMSVWPRPPSALVVRSDVVWDGPQGCAPTRPGHGSLDKEMIRRIIRSHLDEVRACYEKRLMAGHYDDGRVMVQFAIAADGNVAASAVESSTIPDDALEQCLVRTVRAWRFPRPCGGGKVIVSYPFVLKMAH